MTDASSPGDSPTVLFIGGFGRSGSTLLERVLDQVDGAVAVGEMVHLIERGLIRNEDCSCGRPFHDCPFWTDVGAKAFGGWDLVDGLDWLALKQRVDRNRFIPLMVAPILPRHRRAMVQHAERLSQLYAAIAEVAGASLIIDSSKHSSTAFLLRRVPGIRLSVLQLVRDSRGVAYSWTKKVARPEIHGGVTLMPRYHPASAAAHWLSYNALFEMLRLVGTSVTFVRYEDFLAAPVAETARVIATAGQLVRAEDLTFLTDEHVDLVTGHSVAGNPMRFLSGRVDLAHDQEWRDKLARRQRFLVTTITAPLLARYGYLRARRSARWN
jgi:hypothetical protein